jgi:hypothetical protein
VKAATISVERMLKKSVQTESRDKTPNWRARDANFVKNTSGGAVEPGSVTFSSGWFGQGHEVGASFHCNSRANLTGNSLGRAIQS